MDMIITGAKVLTMDETRPRADAVGVAAGRIVAVGTEAEVLALRGPQTRVIEAGGRTLLPGFVESHLHLVLGGNELAQLQLGGVAGFDALRAAFGDFAAQNPDLPLVMAQGAAYEILDKAVTRHDLDRIIEDRPLAMMAPDHHTVWANTAALRAAGLLNGYATPPGHEVVMENGLAIGELREFEAFGPVLALGGNGHLQLGIATGGEPDPWPSPEQRARDKEIVAAGLAHCASYGITSMVNMDGNRYTCVLLAEMQAEGRLTARVKVPFHFKPHMELSELDRASAMQAEFADEWVSSGFVKMFMDGVVDSRTAFMLNDYPGVPGHKSEPLFAPGRFKEICAEIDRRGLQIAVHAIGDGAVRTTIDGYEAAGQANGFRDMRHRIEHIELIDRADVPRLGALGITASLQPPHPPGAMEFPMSTMENVFAPERWRDAYLWKTLADHGAKVAYASDWPVTDVSVMRGIQAALTRIPYAGAADERLGLMETLHAYTAGGAWAAHMEGLTGRLVVGMAADIVMIDGDIETTPARDLGKTGIALTICDGQITHRGQGFA